MKKLAYLMLSLLCVGFIASCSDDDEVENVPTPPAPQEEGILVLNSSKELMFDAAQGQQEVAFNANMGWTAEVAASNWLSVEPAKGEAGDIKMIVKVAANAETETRTGKIVLTTNDKKAKETIVVNQMQKDALVIAKAAYEIGYEGGEIVVKVGHNVEFDVKANVNWIKKQGSRAYTEEDLVFVVDANDGAAREGIITFSSKDGALKQEVKVSQEARPEDAALVVAEKQYTIAPEGGEITVKVNHNVEFDCTIDADWIVKDGTRAMQETSLTFVVAANETSEVREAKITFVAKNDASLKQIVTVRQNAGEGLVLGQTEYALSAEAQDIEIKVMHNVEFDHAIEGDWITLKETRSMQESTLVFSIAANEDTTDYNTREGKITFTSKDGKLSQEVKISQVAPGALVISQNEYTMAHDGGDLWLTINHNVEFTVAVDGEWIQQYDATRALEASTIGFKIVANESNDMRQGKITFTSKDGSLSQEVIVKQEGAPKVEVQPEPAGLVLEIDDNKFSQWVYDQGDYSYKFKGQRPSITFLYDESSDMNLLTIMEQVAPEYIGKVDFFKMDLTGDKNGATRRYVGVGELPNLYFASADIWPYPEMKDACNSATADTLRAWLKTAFNVEGDGGAATTEKIEVEFETIPQFPAEGGEKIVFINIVDLAQGHYFKYSLVGDDNNEHFELPAFEWLKYGVSGLLHLNAKPNTTAAEINSVSLRLTIEDAEFYGKVLVEKVMPLSIAAGQGGGETVDPLTLTLTAAYDKAADAVSLNAQCVSKDAASASIMLIDIPQLNEMIASGMTIEEYFQIMNSIGGTLPLDDTQLANLNGEGFSIQLGAEVGLEAGVEYAFILGAYDAEYMMCKVARADVMFGEATTPEVTAPELEITSEFDAAENKLKFFVKSPSKNVESASYRCETKASIDELLGYGITLDQILDEMGEPLAGVDEVNGAGRMIVRSDKPAGEWYTCIVRATNAGGSTLKSLEAEFVGVEPFEATVTAAYEATENVINVNTVCTTKNAKLMGYFMVIPTQELDDTLVANGMTLEDYMMQYAMPYGKAEMIPDAVISTVNGEGFTMKAGADKNLIAGTNYACVVALYGPKAKMKAFRADTQFGEAPVAEETLYVKPETIAQFPAAGGVTRVKFGIKNHIQGHFLKFELIGNENGYFEDPIAQWPNYPTDCVFDLTANPNTTAEEINSVSLRIKIEDNEWYGNVVAEKVLPLSIAAGAPAPVEATVAVDPGVLEFAAEGGKQIVNLKKLYTGMGNMKYEIVGENSAMFSRADNWVNYGVENNLEVTAQPNTTGALVTANLEIWVEDFSKKVIGEKVIVPLSIAAGESKPEVDPANCYKLLTDKSQLKAGAEVLFLSPDDAWILTGDDATDGGSYFCKAGSSMFTLDAAAQMITDPGQGQIFIVEESTAAAGAFRFVVKGLDSYLESYGTGKYDDLGFGGGTKDDRCVWNVNAGENNTWNVANLPEFSGKHCLTYDKSYPAFSGGNPGEVNYVRIYVK